MTTNTEDSNDSPPVGVRHHLRLAVLGERPIHLHHLLHAVTAEPELAGVLADQRLENLRGTLVLALVDVDGGLPTLVKLLLCLVRDVGLSLRETRDPILRLFRRHLLIPRAEVC